MKERKENEKEKQNKATAKVRGQCNKFCESGSGGKKGETKSFYRLN